MLYQCYCSVCAFLKHIPTDVSHTAHCACKCQPKLQACCFVCAQWGRIPHQHATASSSSSQGHKVNKMMRISWVLQKIIKYEKLSSKNKFTCSHLQDPNSFWTTQRSSFLGAEFWVWTYAPRTAPSPAGSPRWLRWFSSMPWPTLLVPLLRLDFVLT